MALQSFQLDPEAGGVSLDTFDAHTHNYSKLTKIGVDNFGAWTSPKWLDVLDDGIVHVDEGIEDLEAVGVEVETLPTSTPV